MSRHGYAAGVLPVVGSEKAHLSWNRRQEQNKKTEKPGNFAEIFAEKLRKGDRNAVRLGS